jgi:2,5-diamino-6-(ribosylamino)-4(3H)-pyrimidinone 5'-phosphate reductase
MDKPRVVVYGEASADGRITISPGVLLLHGDDRWNIAAGRSDSYATLLQTYKPQAFLEGSLSLTREEEEPEPLAPYPDDPEPLYRDFLPEAVVNRLGHRGWFTMVDSRGRVRWHYKEWPDEAWAGWHVLALVSHATPPAYLAYLRKDMIPYLVAGDQQVDLALALHKLHRQLGVERVISTSPGKLGGALLRCGLVDEIHLDVFPAIIGGTNTPSLFASSDLGLHESPTRLKLISATAQAEGRIALRYAVMRGSEK